MGRINRYQQNKLASSIVGTPGVDTSGQMLGQSISQTAGSLANTVFQVESAKQEIVNASETLKHTSQFDSEFDAGVQDIYTKYVSEPTKALENVTKFGQDLMGRYSSGISNPSVKGSFEKQALNSIANQAKSTRSWANTKQTEKAINDLNTSYSTLAAQAGTINDLNTFNTLLQTVNGSSGVAFLTFGKSASEKIMKVKQDVTKNLIYGNITNDPGLVLDWIDNNALVDPETKAPILDQAELTKIRGEAQTAFKAQAEQVKFNEMRFFSKDMSDLTDAVVLNDETSLIRLNNQEESIRATLDQIIGVGEKEEGIRGELNARLLYIDELRKNYLKRNTGSADGVVDYAVYGDIVDKIKGLAEEDDAVALVKKIRGISTDILKASNMGKLDIKSADALTKLMRSYSDEEGVDSVKSAYESVFLEGVEDIRPDYMNTGKGSGFVKMIDWLRGKRGKIEPLNVVLENINNWDASAKEVDFSNSFSAKKAMTDFAIDEIMRLQQSGKPLDSNTLKNITDRAVIIGQRVLSPESAFYAVGSYVATPFGPRKVLSISATGKAQLAYSDEDLMRLNGKGLFGDGSK